MNKTIATRCCTAVALLCLFFVFSYGVGNLKTYPIENDEFRTLNHIEPVWLEQARSLPDSIRSVASLSPQHGPVYFLFLNVWHKLVGADLFSLRLLSVYFGVLSIAALYQVALISKSHEIACAAVMAMSFLAFYIHFSHNMRMYTLVAAVSGWVIWSYWKALRSQAPGSRIWTSLFAAVALMPYIHYLGTLIVVGVGIYHVIMFRRDRRWWLILTVLILASLLFLPWLPVALGGLTEHQTDVDATGARLVLFDAIRAVLSILSNGIALLPLLVAGITLKNFARLTSPERFLGFITLFTVAALFVLNEVAPILVENRMRYTVILAVPYACVVAIALRLISAGSYLRILCAVAWCLSCFYYLGTDDYLIFTNLQQQGTKQIPRYQDVIYELQGRLKYNELVLSFHPTKVVSPNKTLPYYRKALRDQASIVHITYDEDGELLIQRGYSPFSSLDAISLRRNSVWVLYNPDQTALDDLPVSNDWLLQRFKACIRYHDTEISAIDYYVAREVPCDLVNQQASLTVLYDNGFVLDNAITELSGDELNVYLRWGKAIDKEYSLTLQIFDQFGAKVRQLDAVISGDPVDVFTFDLSELGSGEQSVELIVYSIETGRSVPGTVAIKQQRFERSLSILSFSIDEK